MAVNRTTLASQATRRGSVALGSVALLALTQFPGTEAKKKKKKKSCASQVTAACTSQVAPCLASLSTSCAQLPDPAACTAKATTCCQSLATCDFAAMIACVATLAPAPV